MYAQEIGINGAQIRLALVSRESRICWLGGAIHCYRENQALSAVPGDLLWALLPIYGIFHLFEAHIDTQTSIH